GREQAGGDIAAREKPTAPRATYLNAVGQRSTDIFIVRVNIGRRQSAEGASDALARPLQLMCQQTAPISSSVICAQQKRWVRPFRGGKISQLSFSPTPGNDARRTGRDARPAAGSLNQHCDRSG